MNVGDTEAAEPLRPRVLHLSHSGAAGGAEYALIRMLQAGVSWRPALLVPPPGGGGGIFQQLPRGVPLRVSGVRQPAGVAAGKPLPMVDATARLAVQAAATRANRGFQSADIVDANTTRSAAYGALAAQTSRVPFVVHMRDMADPEAIGRFGFEVMRRLVLPRADGIIADTRATMQSVERYLRRGTPTEVIPSASGLLIGGAPPLPSGPLVIGMLARIDPWKAQAELLDAFAQAFAGGESRLQFAGDALFGHEDYLAHLRRRAAELGVADRVDFLGHVDDVGALLSTWHIAVQYSLRSEPLGQNVLQYLAAGRIVVVADEGGPAEWVEDGVNGVRVPPRDVVSLASTLRRLGADPAARGSLAAAASSTPHLLSDAAVAQSHADFYARILACRVATT